MSILVDASADVAVLRVAHRLAEDLGRVSGVEPSVLSAPSKASTTAVVIGVAGQSALLDGLAAAGKWDRGQLPGRWEALHRQVVEDPWPGVKRALIVVGADRRGAIYGTYELSEQLGVSAWHWFADVPVAHLDEVHVSAESHTDYPRVRYRGFFINDEDPALGSWAKQHFGGVNAAMYERVFDLLLRLKGNYLWPAMWAPRAFHLDDERNTALADEMGVVMGSSHHEPMTRAQSEWHRSPQDPTTGGAWNYATNAENLNKFWRGGIERMVSKGEGKAYESLVTVGMRGDGDEPMADGTASALLESVVKAQRLILEKVTGKPASETPQVWALYKEVQDYYDQGMTVPDDVTLLFSDDNWGQIRRLPPSQTARRGGYGVYYHFDYVGGPRNYKWLNTVQVPKVWQQMDLAYAHGARNLWVVNVGDIKPMEYPLDFFLRMAWNPEAMTPEVLEQFPKAWAQRLFGPDLAVEIAQLCTTYSQYAARRKPELINEDTFPVGPVSASLLHPGKMGRYVHQWRALVAQMVEVRDRLAPEQLDAYFQLIEFPIAALSNLYELYYATAWNRRLASVHDARANYFISRAEEAFARDAALTRTYHKLKGGKWEGMMSQVHMNYVIWNEPTQQTLPPLTRVAADRPLNARDAAVVFAPVEFEQTADALRLDASEFVRSTGAHGLQWQVIQNLGQSRGSVLVVPQGSPSTSVEDGMLLEYPIVTKEAGDWELMVHLSPTLDTDSRGGLRLGLSIDKRAVKIVNAHLVPTAGAARTPQQRAWVDAVIRNRHTVSTSIAQLPAGEHRLKVWRLDDNVIVEELELLKR